MHPETLQLLKDLQAQLAVALAWPASDALRSRLNVAIMRGEGGKEPDETASLRAAYADLLSYADGLSTRNTQLTTALKDAISTFREDDKTTLVSAERQEAWIAALDHHEPKN
jgi:elongation factor P hydroxylase